MPECPDCGSDEAQLCPDVRINTAEGRVTSVSTAGGKYHAFCLGCGAEFRVYETPDGVDPPPDRIGARPLDVDATFQ